MNQIACPYCRGVISGQGIAAGQLLVCPHCGRQFVRPSGTPAAQATAPTPTAAPSPMAGSVPMAASAPARAPAAAAPAPRPVGTAQPQGEPSYASQYAEQRQARGSTTIIWIVVCVVIGLLVLGLIGMLIFQNVGDRQRSKIEPQLFTEARKHIKIKANEEKVTEMLNLGPGPASGVVLKDDHVVFGRGTATVYLKVKGQKKYITIKFRLSGDEWSIEGPIEVTSGK